MRRVLKRPRLYTRRNNDWEPTMVAVAVAVVVVVVVVGEDSRISWIP